MNLLVLLFALAALVWMIPLARSGRLIRLAVVVLLTGTVVGPSFFAVQGPIQISIDRMLFFATVGFAFIGLRIGTTELPKPHRVDWLMLAMLGWFCVSALLGGTNPPGTPPLARWLFYIAMPVGMYGLARVMTIRTDDIRWMFRCLIGLGIYLAVTAVLEIQGLHGLVFPRYIVNADDWEFFGRGRGPLMNPAGNGIVMAVSLTAVAVGFVTAGRGKRATLAAMAVCLLVGIYATLTRSVWLGGVAAIGMVGFIYSPRSLRVYCLLVAVLGGGLFSMGLKDQLVRMKRDKNLSAADAQKSVQLRPLLAIVAWEMFQDAPLAGHGFGHYVVKHHPYHDDRSYELPLEVARPYVQHNVFLSVLVDTGLIGSMLFASWFISLAGIAWRLARDELAKPEVRNIGLVMLGTLLSYLCNGMFHDVLIIPMIQMYLFFLSGVTLTAAQKGLAAAPAENEGRPRRARDVATLGVAPLGAAAPIER
ncbi:MAG: O-antigen ligase family protein [Planctomycetota bacterium]